MNNSGHVTDIECTVEHETERACLLRNSHGDQAWFPKSQIEDNGDGTFTIPVWLLEQKEWEY